eukprot:TRINITY_DN15304_c0_g1_i2.p2 TRINITY_DN15304_c0_g1~~TRINITY_DN15304_c0_g1_i2.p2  ORF type:complete len:125 (-),score=13.76 TRINITY_DN15304_c0_g1_i2:8-382(-)
MGENLRRIEHRQRGVRRVEHQRDFRATHDQAVAAPLLQTLDDREDVGARVGQQFSVDQLFENDLIQAFSVVLVRREHLNSPHAQHRLECGPLGHPAGAEKADLLAIVVGERVGDELGDREPWDL